MKSFTCLLIDLHNAQKTGGGKFPPPVDIFLAGPHDSIDSTSMGMISCLRLMPKPQALSFGTARSQGI